MTERRRLFDEIADGYDAWRPRYCDALFQAVIEHAGFDAAGSALEVGCGTGQATEAFLKTGGHVLAVELGVNMAAFAAEKFRGYPNFTVQNIAFEDFEPPEGPFDLFYSASAFHWVPPEIGYPKAMRLLKAGGTLAVFWCQSMIAPGQNALQGEIDTIRARYACDSKSGFGVSDDDRKHLGTLAMIESFGFADAHDAVFETRRRFSSDDYVRFLDTFSSNRARPKDERAAFYEDVRRAVDRCGGAFDVVEEMELYLARKAGA